MAELELELVLIRDVGIMVSILICWVKCEPVEKSFICLLTPQVATMTRGEPGWSQESQLSLGFPM